jgi:Kdo2-lipid IVA lauroyltransferase/acyltransferase
VIDRAREGALLALISLLGGAVRMLPRGAALSLGRGLGAAGYLLVGGRRRLALDNIRRAFPAMGPREARAIARASFAGLGMNAVEFLLLPRLDAAGVARLMQIDGEEHLREALARGKGVLLLTGHFGNWDLLGVALAQRGFPLTVLSKVSRSGAVNRLWMGTRERAGVRILTGRNIMRSILGELRKGGVVGFVLDQNALRKDGVFVPFFGRPACTLSALAVLAARTGAPVVPLSTWREGGRHRAVIEPALPPPPPGEEGVVERTAAYTRWTEQVIRRRPAQWTWLHDRWRTRPVPVESGTGLPSSPAPAPPRSAVFLDRDGTLIDELGYLGDPGRVAEKIYPGAPEAVRLLAAAGFAVVLVTNQSGVGRGYYPAEGAQAVNLRLAQEIAGRNGGKTFSAAYFCPHLPDAGCSCRKPEEGMVRRAAFDLGIDIASSWVVGDMDRDILLAKRLGMRGALVRTGHAGKGEIPPGTPEFEDVLAAARAIVAEAGRP